MSDLPLTPGAPAEDLRLTSLPARQGRRYAEPLVLLHGWGCDGRSWQPLLEGLNANLDLLLVDLPEFPAAGPEAPGGWLDGTPEVWLEQLLQALPERFVLLGWSLGGMLATRLAARAPERVLGLMTLASNVKFVASDDWPEAMSGEVFSQFEAGFAEAPADTLKRFAGLMAKGDERERRLLKPLREACGASWDESQRYGERRWQATLGWLAHLDNREAFARLSVPGCHWLAAADALVPVAAAGRLRSLNPRQSVQVIEKVGHALPWSAPLVGELMAFVDRIHYAVDKRKVAQSFGRAAAQYDSVAGLQRQIGHRLLTAASATGADTCLDLGCGTGYFTPYLAAGCSTLLAMDLSEGMLGYARQRLHSAASAAPGEQVANVLWLGGDAEAMPLASGAVDKLYSSLAIQWCADLPALFREIRRVLHPAGRAYIATLGPDTLKELRLAWSAVDRYTHVNHFAAEADLRTAIDAAGLQVRDWQAEQIVLQYEQVRDLTYELKTLGAHNMNQGQSSGLTGRQRLLAFKQAYEQFRQDNGQLPATYDVFYLELSL